MLSLFSVITKLLKRGRSVAQNTMGIAVRMEKALINKSLATVHVTQTEKKNCSVCLPQPNTSVTQVSH